MDWPPFYKRNGSWRQTEMRQEERRETKVRDKFRAPPRSQRGNDRANQCSSSFRFQDRFNHDDEDQVMRPATTTGFTKRKEKTMSCWRNRDLLENLAVPALLILTDHQAGQFRRSDTPHQGGIAEESPVILEAGCRASSVFLFTRLPTFFCVYL